MPFLSARGLSGLKNYKYQSAGYTLLDDIHQPFWNCKRFTEASQCSLLIVNNNHLLQKTAVKLIPASLLQGSPSSYPFGWHPTSLH